MRKAEQERLREVEKEQAYLIRAWHRWHADELDKALQGPHGALFSQLMALLRDLAKTTPDDLVAFVRAQNWSAVDYETRLVALHEVNQAITRHRVRRGLAPFEDALPGAPLTPFQRVRRILTIYPRDAEAMSGPTPTEIKRHQIEDYQL